MKIKVNCKRSCAALLAVSASLPAVVGAQDVPPAAAADPAEPAPAPAPAAEPPATRERTAEAAPAPAAPAPGSPSVEERVEVLSEEVRRLREQMVIPEKEELRSAYGLGPAASRVYGSTRGLSIGGYGEFHYQNVFADGRRSDDRFDIPRVVLYTGYKFTDRILMNVELEFEHAMVAEVEFAYLDFLLDDAANARVGLMLVPMGFVNEFHEPPFYQGNLRPLVERKIIPTTWREIGAGLFGEPIEGLTYKAYVVTGMRATGFGPGGWAGGRQHARQALGEDVAVTASLDWEASSSFRVGASGWYGGADQDEILSPGGAQVPVDTGLAEAHAQFQHRGLRLRALGAAGWLRNASHLTLHLDPAGSALIGSRVAGGYGEVSYDVLSLLGGAAGGMALEPWFRFERVDTQHQTPAIAGRAADGTQNVTAIEAGLAFKPITQVVLKGEYVRQTNDAGTPVADSVFAGGGFIF